MSVTKELRCSRYLSFITLFMIPFPVSYLFFSFIIFELDTKGAWSMTLSFWFWIATFLWIYSGFGIRKLKKPAWYTFLLAQIITVMINLSNVVNFSHSEFKVWAFFFTILIQSYVYVLVAKELRVPFLFPKIAWWRSGLVGIPHLEVELNHLTGVSGSSRGQILDLNNRGCFIKTPHEFGPFEKITINVDQFGHKVDIQGFVAWNAKSTVTHPKGIGICFVELNRQKRRKVRVISQRFIKQKQLA